MSLPASLHLRQWGDPGNSAVLCLHGLNQHGGIFSELATHLARRGYYVAALDLRGHGESPNDPPWSLAMHVADVLESVAALGIERPIWVGHSFGGRVAAAAAARSPETPAGIALLDPAFQIEPRAARRRCEIERRDWTFETPEAAVRALTQQENTASPDALHRIREFVERDARLGADGRYHFSYSPPAVVVAWSEMTLADPDIALVPTLIVRPGEGNTHPRDQRYRELPLPLTERRVSGGHNVLWEAADETIASVSAFVESCLGGPPAMR